MNPETKICSKCRIEKSIDDFYFRKDRKQYYTYCKKCRKEYLKLFKKRHIEKNKSRDFSKEQKECLICGEIKNKTEFFKRDSNSGVRPYCKKCEKKKNNENYDIKKHSERWKTYYENNKEKVLLKNKKWRIANKKYFNIYVKQRKKGDPSLRLLQNIRSLFNNNLKYYNIDKNKKIFEYTGIQYKEYINHFKKDEYWKDFYNGRKIHIDHIIPCSAYNFNLKSEIKRCWNPHNLRLLPAKENAEKHTLIDHTLIKKHGIEHLLPRGFKNAS